MTPKKDEQGPVAPADDPETDREDPENGLDADSMRDALVKAKAADAEDGFDTLQSYVAETLIGDVRDFILDRLRHEQGGVPWDEREEFEQKTTIHATTEAARRLVRSVVEVVAAEGRVTLRATVKSVKNDGKEIAIAATCPITAEERHALFDSSGARILMVLPLMHVYGEGEEVEIAPDAPGLPLEQGDELVGSGDGVED